MKRGVGNIVPCRCESEHQNRPSGLPLPIFPRDAMERERSLPGHHVFNSGNPIRGSKGESKFSTWMHKVALNTAITHIRRQYPGP